jgi:hypothetical protein
MPRILIISAVDLTPELGGTVLFRRDIERSFAPSPQAALGVAPSVQPNLVLVASSDMAEARALIRQLREQAGTRRSSVAVLCRSASLSIGDEEALREAGANLVLVGQVDGSLWDGRIEELLQVPARREARIPVRFEVWSRFEEDAALVEAVGLNISVRGMLLETRDPLDRGMQLDLSFSLPPQQDELHVVGRVVREAGESGTGFRSGAEFLILRGNARERIRAFIETKSGH